MKKHRNLTAESFAHLLRALHEDPSLAAEQYEHIRQALILFFTFRGVHDPLQMTDETFNRVATRLVAGQEIFAQNPINYFYGVARNVWRESLAQPHIAQSFDDPLSLESHTALDPYTVLLQEDERQDYELRLQCLENCLQKLSATDRELMIAYYQGTGNAKIENRQAIASRLDISLKTLRNKTSRLRSELSACVRDCLAAKGKTTSR